jgi:hypothetical protein
MTIDMMLRAAWAALPKSDPRRALPQWATSDATALTCSHLFGPGYAACRLANGYKECYQFTLINAAGRWRFHRMCMELKDYAAMHLAWPGRKSADAVKLAKPRAYLGAWRVKTQAVEDYPYERIEHLTFIGRGNARRPAWVQSDAMDNSDGWMTGKPKASALMEDMVAEGAAGPGRAGEIVLEFEQLEAPSAATLAALRRCVARRRLGTM